jgi:biotin carboxyl carrier protein
MEIQIGNRLAEVTLISKEGNKVKIDIDGKVYDVDVAMLENGICSILHDGNSYNAEMVRSANGKHYQVNMNYSTYQIDMLDSQAKYMRLRKKQASEKQGDKITAPMPCKIVKIYVKPGDELKAGDTVLTMEAMKMQSNITVSEDCRVTGVLVQEGDSAMVEQALITLQVNAPEA